MYPSYDTFAVAITRTCGSGGNTIGKRLAADYGIDLYDRKLLALASDDSGINETIFAAADEDTRKTWLYRVSKSVYDGREIAPETGNFLSDQNLFNYQAKVLEALLEKESYVCIGRAADFVLRNRQNIISVYLDAPYDFRVGHEMKRQGISEEAARRYIDKLDKYRNSYYVYHTGRKWKNAGNYDLCLNTAKLGMDNAATVIEEYIRLRFGVEPKKK